MEEGGNTLATPVRGYGGCGHLREAGGSYELRITPARFFFVEALPATM